MPSSEQLFADSEAGVARTFGSGRGASAPGPASASGLAAVSDRHILAEQPYAQPRGSPDRWYPRTGCHAAELASYAPGQHRRRAAWLAPADPGLFGPAGPGTGCRRSRGHARSRGLARGWGGGCGRGRTARRTRGRGRAGAAVPGLLGCHHDVPRLQGRTEPPRNAETDDTAYGGWIERRQKRAQLFWIATAADNRHAGPSRDAGLLRKTSHDQYRPWIK